MIREKITNNYFVSVIIITRNRPQMLKGCLDRLLEQEYRFFEVIVVDSSTSQETEQVVKSYNSPIIIKYVGLYRYGLQIGV